jgi:WD40 repeat protein
VRVWNVPRGSFLGEPLTLPGDALWLVFDGRGTRLAVASADNAVRVYRLQDGGQEAEQGGLELVTGPLTNWPTQYHYYSHLPPVWVDDDRSLLTCASHNEVGWWDAGTGKEVRRLRPNLSFLYEIVASPDGQHIAVAAWWGCQLYQARTGMPVGVRLQHTNLVPCAAFSPDGRWLLTVSRDQSLKLWSVPGGELQGTALQLSNQGYATAFLGDRLVAGQVDGLIRLWQPGQATLPFRDFPVPTEIFMDRTALVDADGGYLLAPAPTKGAQVIDLASGLPAGQALEKAGPLLQGTFLPRHFQVVLQTRQTVGAWDWRTGQPLWGPVNLPSVGYSVVPSPDGRWVVSLCADRGLLLDATTGQTVSKFVHEGKPDLVNSYPNARFSPDGTCFVTFKAWSTVTVWDTQTARPRFAPLPHGDRVDAVAFSEDGRYLATASDDNSARVFDLATGRELAKLGEPNWVRDVAFSADGRLLLTTGSDGSARLWDWGASKLVCPPMAQGQEINNACFLPGSPWLVTRTGETVQLWDSVLGKPVTPHLPKKLNGWGLRLIQGDRQLAAFGEHGQARVFDLSPLADDNPQGLTPEQIRLLAEIGSMYTIHEGGGLVRLTTAEWLDRWRRLRRERPDLLPWSEKGSLEQWLGADQSDTLRSFLEQARTQFGADDPRTAAALAELGLNLLRQNKHADAEKTLRDCLTLRQKNEPDAWATFNTQSMLGEALLGQKHYGDAEPLLRAGYEGVKQHQAEIPPPVRSVRLTEALQRLVRLYDAWGKPDEAARWQKALEEAKEKTRQPEAPKP